MNTRLKSIIRYFFLFCIFFTGACCPTGAWEDNFGNEYNLASVPPASIFDPVVGTMGNVDLSPSNCGIWTVRPPSELEPPPLSTTTIVWIAVNPAPDPTDGCCYAIRFEGNSTDIFQCNRIEGIFQNVGGKCDQIGFMSLVPVIL